MTKNIKSEKMIIRILIISIIVLIALYSLKFFNIVFNKLGIGSPIKIDHKWWKGAPYSLFIYAVALLFFLLTFLFRGTANLNKKSILLAFFVSLLVEMYGFSFSLYFLYIILGHNEALRPYLFSPSPSTFLSHIIRFPVLIISWVSGLFLVIKGWQKIWGLQGELVTDGIYARLRHPQYLGLIIILFGSLFFFPTPLLLGLFIISAFMYYNLAREEENKMESRFGELYCNYKNRVSMWGIKFPK